MYYPIKLDKTRNLRYGMKAISRIEKSFKKSVGKIDFENMTMEEMATLIWAGLAHEDNNLTTDKVMDIIDENSNIKEVLAVVSEALDAAFGAKKEKEEGKNE